MRLYGRAREVDGIGPARSALLVLRCGGNALPRRVRKRGTGGVVCLYHSLGREPGFGVGLHSFEVPRRAVLLGFPSPAGALGYTYLYSNFGVVGAFASFRPCPPVVPLTVQKRWYRSSACWTFRAKSL